MSFINGKFICILLIMIMQFNAYSFDIQNNKKLLNQTLSPKSKFLINQIGQIQKIKTFLNKMDKSIPLKKSTKLKILLFGGPLLYFIASFLLGYYVGYLAAFIFCPFILLKSKDIGVFIVNLMRKIVENEYKEYLENFKKTIAPNLSEVDIYQARLELDSIYAKALLTFPYVDDLALIRKISSLENELHNLYEFKAEVMVMDDTHEIKDSSWQKEMLKILENDSRLIENEIQPELKEVIFNSDYLTLFRQCQIFIHPKLNYVIKEFVNNVIEQGDRRGVYLRQYAFKNWKNAKRLAGDLMVPFLIGHVSIYDQEKGKTIIKEAVIQEKFKGAELTEIIVQLAKQKDINSIKNIITLFFEADKELMKRGVYPCDPLLDNAVLTNEQKVLFIDGGMYEINPIASDFYVRGKCHMLNNKFFNSLKNYGLNENQLRELMNHYGKVSGIYILEFDDKYFGFFEEGIKMDRYYARGEEDFENYFNQDVTDKENNPVIWNKNPKGILLKESKTEDILSFAA